MVVAISHRRLIIVSILARTTNPKIDAISNACKVPATSGRRIRGQFVGAKRGRPKGSPKKTSAARGLEDWYRVRLMMERQGGDLKGFVAASKLSRATLHRISTGADVTDNVKKTLCHELGYSFDIWDPSSDPTISLKELEAEFFEWLAAGGRQRASSRDPSPIRSLDFLSAPSSPLVGRRKELEAIENQINQNEQCIVEIHGPSGSGKTELVRGWWGSSGKKRINGHVLAFSCRRIGTADALLDKIRSQIGAETPETDLPSLLSIVTSGAPHRNTAIILDDLDFLLHGGWVQEDSDRRSGLRVDRAASVRFRRRRALPRRNNDPARLKCRFLAIPLAAFQPCTKGGFRYDSQNQSPIRSMTDTG